MIALVTGAARGIGRATALAFAERKLALALLVRSPVDELLVELRARGAPEVVVVTCDVSDANSVEAASGAVMAALGVPDIVVNNAGVVRRGTRIEDTSVEDWDRVMGVNTRGPFLVSRAFLPRMRARGSGRFIHIGSISSTLACPNNASYGASKWALLGFAKSLAEELRGSGLQSMCMLPGSVDTDMLKDSGFAPSMTADEVAQTVLFLALDAPPSIHSSVIELFG